MFDEYLLNNYKDELLRILQDEDTEKHFSLIINFPKLFEHCVELGDALLKEPVRTLKKFNKKLLKAQRNLLTEEPSYTEKLNVHVRISGLPAFPEIHRAVFPTSHDLGSFLQISGTVVRITAQKLLEYRRQYRCTKCKNIITVEADYEQRFVFKQPKICSMGECYGKNVIQIKNLEQSNCKDYQEIKLQEQVSKLCLGSMPSSMWVTLEDDLVDCCKPGDDVTVCGIVMRRWRPLQPGRKLDIELVIRANNVEINNDQHSIKLITSEIKAQFHEFWEEHKNSPLAGRDIILRSICPQLYGLYIVKLAVSVVLAGGSTAHKMENTGVRIRAEPHLLLVGDPGTGKSQLLRFASKIIPRSVLTTGIGCTSAGLTVAAVMEDGEWQLEAGALVLSDEGICCIDEFNSMKEHDRASIHEAMEQQTISVAKASMVCKLSTRCSILAATNPKGHIDPNQSLSLNVAMASPLLSRFDLVLMLKDSIDYNWDEVLCDYILNDQITKNEHNEVEVWSVELLQAYFTVIKGLHPTLTAEANSILSSYYQAQRQAPTRNLARTTVRLLDSLVRLSQGHARLMFRSEVLVMDAIMAVALVESSMQGAALLLPVDIDTLHAPFPQDPMRSYIELMTTILTKLKLYDLLNNEVNKLQNDDSNVTDRRDLLKNNFENHKKMNVFENQIETGYENVNKNDGSKILKDQNLQEKCPNSKDKKTPGILLKNKNLKETKSNVTVNTSISHTDEIIRTKSKRKSNSDERENKSNSKKGKKLLNDTDLMNLIPSVNDDIFELNELDLELPGEPLLLGDEVDNKAENLQTSSQIQTVFDKKLENLKEQFEYKSYHKTLDMSTMNKHKKEDLEENDSRSEQIRENPKQFTSRKNVHKQNLTEKYTEQIISESVTSKLKTSVLNISIQHTFSDNSFNTSNLNQKQTEKVLPGVLTSEHNTSISTKVNNKDTIKQISPKQALLDKIAQFAFKKVKRDENSFSENDFKGTEKIDSTERVQQKFVPQKTISTESEVESSQSSSQLSAKNLFQSQGDIDDLDLDF